MLIICHYTLLIHCLILIEVSHTMNLESNKLKIQKFLWLQCFNHSNKLSLIQYYRYVC